MQDSSESEVSQQQDCLPCRVMGATVFTGIGLYTAWEGRRQLRQSRPTIISKRALLSFRAQQFGIFGMATTMIGLGIYRAIL